MHGEESQCQKIVQEAQKQLMQSNNVIEKLRNETDFLKQKEMRLGEAAVQTVLKRHTANIASPL